MIGWKRKHICMVRPLFLMGCLLLPMAAHAAPPSLWLEELTWPEVRAALEEGYSSVIIPTGGTEQNGPHMALGKHNAIMHYTAERIAKEAGRTLVAPVLAYVPEGDPDGKEGHMAFPGTLSTPEPVFAAVLEAAARSLKTHGFKRIFLIGDSGGNQNAQSLVAARLTALWQKEGVRVIHVADYYDPEREFKLLEKNGFSRAEIGTHAGIADTSALLSVRPQMIRAPLMKFTPEGGGHGKAEYANAQWGQAILNARISAAVARLQENALP